MSIEHWDGEVSYKERLVRVAETIIDNEDSGVTREQRPIVWTGKADRFGVPLWFQATLDHATERIARLRVSVDDVLLCLEPVDSTDLPPDDWTRELVEVMEVYYTVKAQELGTAAVRSKVQNPATVTQ